MRLSCCSFFDAKIKEAWLFFEKEVCPSPFLYYDYMKYVYRQTLYFNLFYWPKIYCVLSDEGEILMIAPLKWNIAKNSYKMLSDIQGVGLCDFLYSPKLTNEQKEEVLSFFFSEKRKYFLRRVRVGTTLFDFLQKKGIVAENRMPCVKILFGKDFRQYAKEHMSSSVRQNIRTAINRLNRDGRQYRLEVLYGGSADDKVWSEIQCLYERRLFGKYKPKKVDGRLKKCFSLFFYRNIKHDTLSLKKLDNACHFLLYIDGTLSAYFSGLLDYEKKSIVVPRLAINADYSFYSPGYILVSESIKFFQEKTDVGDLDLSRGDEKYKLDFGGVVYETFCFKFSSGTFFEKT